MYLYKQLTILRLLVCDENGLLFQTYDASKKRLPWQNTSYRLRKAFYDDFGSNTLSDEKKRQHAILKCYNATNPNPAPLLKYCRQLFEEDLNPTRSLVTEIGVACRDAQMALNHMEDHDNASWLDDFAEQEWLDPDEYVPMQKSPVRVPFGRLMERRTTV